MFYRPVDSFSRVPIKVIQWVMRKKAIPDVLIGSMMSLCDGARTRFRVDSELSCEFEFEMGMHQGSVLSPFLFAVEVDVVTTVIRESTLSELYADILVLMSETIYGIRSKIRKWMEALESNGFKVSLGKTKVMVCLWIRKHGLSKSNVYQCWICSLIVKAYSYCVISESTVLVLE